MKKTKSLYHDHRFPAAVISCAVRWHVFVRAAARVNNRAENSHQPTRRRERQMCGFRDPHRTQAFLASSGPIRQHFALPRHQMQAACHRILLKEHSAAWYGLTVTEIARSDRYLIRILEQNR